ncbi:MAG: hypothetical protein WC530_09860 [Candidatus Omnitrophota bacterium]|jgi:hypothetical protein
MAKEATMKYVIEAEDRTKTALSSAEGGLTGFNAKVSDMAKGVALGGIALAGVSTAFSFLSSTVRDSIQQFTEAEAAQNRLTQILKTSRNASDFHIQGLINQAEALEKVGVVSKDTIIAMQSQLATFDLSTSAIEKLTPAILDYVVAEKGAGASTEDARALTNGLAQAINGNFAALTNTGFILDEHTKKLISTGNEEERLTAITDVLNSTYAGFNAQARNTSEGGLAVFRNEINNLQEAIGKGAMPVIIEMTNALTPLVQWLTKAANEAGRFALQMVNAKKARVADLKDFILENAGDDIVTIEENIGENLVSNLNYAVPKIDTSVSKIKSSFQSLNNSLEGAQNKISDLMESYGDSIERNLTGHLDRIDSLNESITDSARSYQQSTLEKENKYQDDKLGIYMKHQDNLQSLTETSQRLREQLSEEKDEKERKKIQAQISKTKSAIQEEQDLLDEYGELASAAKERRGMSDFELLEAKHAREMEADEKAYKEKLEKINVQIVRENEAYQKQTDGLVEETKKRFDKIVEEYTKGYGKIIEAGKDDKFSKKVLDQLQSTGKAGLAGLSASSGSFDLVSGATAKASTNNPSVSNQWVFTFNGDITDKQKLIEQVMDAVNRAAELSWAKSAN